MEKIRLLGTGIIICLLTMFVSSVNAQKYKAVFKNLTWEQAAELAQKEGKIVLVDAMRKARIRKNKMQQSENCSLFQKL